ncbi:MAG TPA: DUF192 domain-containing protein [Myxococcaceae bacterium]|jgi:hypothetical protein
MRRAALVVVLALCACPAAADGPGARAPQRDVTAEDYPAPPLPRGHVVLEGAFGKTAVDVEIAATPASTQRGMMWRRELQAGKGMLFVFDGESVHSFWMKNTLIPLDLIFIRADFTVAGVVENAQPRTLTGRGVDRPSQYVLEVPGGWSSPAGIRAGTRVTFDLPPLAH